MPGRGGYSAAAARALKNKRITETSARAAKAYRSPGAKKWLGRADRARQLAFGNARRSALTGGIAGAGYGMYSVLPGPQRANGKSSGGTGQVPPRSMGGYA